MALLNPYISFHGKCEQAMNFYKDCLGGDLVINLVSSMPEMAKNIPAQMHDKVLHSVLTNGGLVLMGTDMTRTAPVEGNTYSISLNCETEIELDDLFKKLSEGGNVFEKPAMMPWGGKFAAFEDKFGKNWMLNYQGS